MDQQEKTNLYDTIKQKIINGYDPRSIYIFGSFARNEESDNSDIDILVEKETDQKMPHRASSVRKLLRGIAYPLDILVYTSEELRQRENDRYSVVYNALHEGKKIYERKG